MSLEERVIDLENRLTKAESQIRLLAEIADFDEHPFIFTCLEADLSGQQVNQIYDLLTDAEDSLNTDSPMNQIEFQRTLSDIVQLLMGEVWLLAKSLMGSMLDEGRFESVCEHFRETGMNI